MVIPLVLGNANTLTQSSGYCQCGNIPRCSICMYKLICPKSPFCCISNSGCDLTPVLSAISQLSSTMSSNFSGLNSSIENLQTSINSIGATLNTMNSSINSIGSVVNDINTKCDEILSKLPATVQNASVFSVDNNAPQSNIEPKDSDVTPVEAELVNPNSLATYSASEPETVFVQKKGLFGKTKWVEEKKK